MEGPFGEALGYMNDAAPAPQMEVTCICHRSDPIFHGIVQQVPPSEGHVVMEMGVLGPLWYYITRKLGLTGIRDLAIAPGAAGVSTLVVQVERDSVSKADSIGRILAKLNFGQKLILLVDEDIDIRDPQTLLWALSARVDPARDITLVDSTKTFQLDPAVMLRARTDDTTLDEPPYTCSLAVINATVRCHVPALSLPPADMMRRILERWPQTGLPEIEPRKRLERMLKSQHFGE
jgi:UbiD family decarboxylase